MVYWTLHVMQLCTAPCICASACATPACLFVSPSRLFLLIDGQWTSAKSDCTHSIRRGLGRRLTHGPGLHPPDEEGALSWSLLQLWQTRPHCEGLPRTTCSECPEC